MDDVIDRFETYSRLTVQAQGLSWKQARPLFLQLDALDKPDRLIDANAAAQVHPLFASIDDGEISGITAPIGLAPTAIVFGMLNAITESATSEAPIALGAYPTINWIGLLDVMGEAVIDPMFAAVRDAAGTLNEQHARLQLLDGRSAPIGTDDDRFEEAGIVACAADAEHATAILRADIDDAVVDELRDLIHKRAAAAKRVLRGEGLASHSPAPIAGDGFMVLPVEMTDEMASACANELMAQSAYLGWEPTAIYRAMLAAAPKVASDTGAG